jgi:N-acetylglucosaminyl-diphospho-decaprenol L-rhamnosyltransferase
VIGAVVVDHDAGSLLAGAVRSILADGADVVVVVENGAAGSVPSALADLLAEDPPPPVRVVVPGRNLGFGAGVNRGLAVLAVADADADAVADAAPPDRVLVANADLVVHPGTIAGLARTLDEHKEWAIVGPRIYAEDGEVYPSVRSFPALKDAAGHALLALFKPDNPFTRRYNPGTPEGDVVVEADWVSGSCFMARRQALDELGGFDEAYFMYAEDTDLCWRAHYAGWGVGFDGRAPGVMHVQGVSTARHPYRMMVAHHRSALRFSVRSTKGWRRAALPLAVVVLGVRMAIATVRLALTRRA